MTRPQFGRRSEPQENLPGYILGLVSVLCSLGFAIWMIKPVGDLRLAAFGYLLIVFGSLTLGLLGRFWIDRGLLWSWLSTSIVGLLGTIIGALHNNPGVQHEFVFFVLLPGVWFLITAGMDIRVLRVLLNVIPFAAILIAILVWAFWLDSTGRVQIPAAHLLDLGQGLGSESFGYEMRFYPISTLVFILPFLTVSLFVKNTYTHSKAAVAAKVAYLPALGLVFIVGRRALLISLLASLILVAVCALRINLRAKISLGSVVLGAIGLVVAVLMANRTGFSFLAMINTVSESRSASDVRAASGDALLASWLGSPVWGNGLGAIVKVPRNIDRPWEFELQYHLVLNALGLVGVIVLGVCTLVVVARSIWLIRRCSDKFGFLLAILAGCFGIFVANASNPYLHTPGQYWMLFILPMALNCIQRRISAESTVERFHRRHNASLNGLPK